MASNHNPQNTPHITHQTKQKELEAYLAEEREEDHSSRYSDQTSRYEQNRLDALTGGLPSTTWDLG